MQQDVHQLPRLAHFYMYAVFSLLRLSNGQHIQMVTALILQLIQCIVISPKNSDGGDPPDDQEEQNKAKKVRVCITQEYLMLCGNPYSVC